MTAFIAKRRAGQFEDLSARYRTFECARAEADSIDRLIALARMNLPKA